jgi:hypothetical protein
MVAQFSLSPGFLFSTARAAVKPAALWRGGDSFAGVPARP